MYTKLFVCMYACNNGKEKRNKCQGLKPGERLRRKREREREREREERYILITKAISHMVTHIHKWKKKKKL